MDEQQARALLKKYTDGTATPEERQQVESYYFRYLRKKDSLPDQKRLLADQQAVRATLQKHLDNDILPAELPRTRPLWPRIAAAASVLIILSVGGYFLLHQQKPVQQVAQNMHDVGPGTDKAILHSHGRQYVLNNSKNGLIVQNGGTSIRKTAGGLITYDNTAPGAAVVYDTLTVPRGGQHRLLLADGTQIYLNAETSIRYPESFTGGERNMELLSGEIDLKVHYDTQQPFSLLVKGHLLHDLGTEFDVSAYNDEPLVKTTLVEGQVAISGSNSQLIPLRPGQQAVFKPHTGPVTVSEGDPEEAIAWKNGMFIFNNENLQSILNKVSRWYDVKINYTPGVAFNESFFGSITRYTNVSQVLNMLEITGHVKFSVSGKTVTVMKK